MTFNLEQTREGHVPAHLAGTYRDIRRELRLTYVPLLFRAIAPHGEALHAAWQQLRPNVITQAFESLADDLRAKLAHVAVDLGTPLIEPVLASAGFDVDDTDEIRGLVDLFHYADPKTLLCLAGLDRLEEGHVDNPAPVPPELLRPIPDGPPSDVPELTLGPEEPGGVAGELLVEIRRELRLPATEIDLQALGHWPRFLDVAWREVGSWLFRQRRLQDSLGAVDAEMRRLARHLPFALDAHRGLLAERPETGPAIHRVTSTLRQPLTRLALFTAALKVSLDGAEEALGSPFPVEWDRPSIDQIEV